MSDKKRFNIHLWPLEKDIFIFEDEDVLHACRANGINIKSSCGGVASCSQCVCKVRSGEDNLSPMKYEEIKLLGNVFHITKERLTCQLKITGDITLDVSDHIGAFNSKSEAPKKVVIRKKVDAEPVIESTSDISETNSVPQTKRLGGGRRPKKFGYSED